MIDASVCLKWAFEEEDSEKARRILEKYERNELLLMAPSLWQFEIVNGFSSAVVRKKLEFQKAKRLLCIVFKAVPELFMISDLLDECFKNTNKYQISGYDSAYVTLAAQTQSVLVSADRKLVEKVGDARLAIYLGEFKME